MTTTPTPKRMWINQPSTLQPLHHLHGTNILAVPETNSVTRVYFLAGDVVSQDAPKNALSEGWIARAQVAAQRRNRER